MVGYVPCFPTGLTRKAILNPEDEDDTDIIPIYRKNHAHLDGNHWSSGSFEAEDPRRQEEPPDLISIVGQLMGTESKSVQSTSSTFSMERCVLLFTYHAVARGGEARFLDYVIGTLTHISKYLS